MNAHTQAIAAYGNPANVQKTTRAAEYEVIARITARLRKAHQATGFSFPELAEALAENRRLWTELAIDLASQNNQLPKPLKLQLLGLARFVDRHTNAVLEGTESVTDLIDINHAILSGLAGKGVPS